jgi:hypothetical protein
MGLAETLTYDADDAYHDLTSTLGATPGLNVNQHNVAAALGNAFNNGASLPPAFANVFRKARAQPGPDRRRRRMALRQELDVDGQIPGRVRPGLAKLQCRSAAELRVVTANELRASLGASVDLVECRTPPRGGRVSRQHPAPL